MELSLKTAVLSAMLATTLLAMALTYIRSLPNAPAGVTYWAAGFWIHALGYLVIATVRPPLAPVLGDILQASSAMVLAAGSLVFLGREARIQYVVVGICLVVFWVLFAAVNQLEFVARTLPVYLFSGVVLLATGVLFWRKAPQGQAAFGYRLVGIVLVLWGLHRIDFPFLRPIEWFAPYGFVIATVLALTTAIGLILVAQHSLMAKAEEEVAARNLADVALRKQVGVQQDIIDAVPIPIFLKDAAGSVVNANRAFADLVGRDMGDILGKGLETFWKDPAVLQAFVTDEAVAVGQAESRDIRLSTAKGEGRDFAISKVPFGGEHGDRSAMVCVMQELTDRKRTEKQLFESEKRFRDFAEISSDWLWETDVESRFTYFAHGARDFSGLVPKDHLGRTRFEATIEDLTSPKWRAHITDIEARRPFSGFRYQLRGDDGSDVTVMINGVPIYDEDGVFAGYRGTGSDVTQQRDAEISRDRARLEAERANRAKSEFLATMSHEFRTPLNAILGFSEMLSKEVLGPIGEQTYKEYAEAINDSGAHMLALVNDVLDISAIEAGKRTFARVEIDVLDLLKECTVEVSPIVADKSINLEVGVPSERIMIFADTRSVRQIVLNLLSNSVKFTPEEGWIKLDARPDRGDMVAISVEDSGEGIPAEKLPTITDPFSQAGTHPHHSHEGTGLGLSIVKSLAEAHGGELSIESTVGVGTKVTVWLPATPEPALLYTETAHAGPKAVLQEDHGNA